MLLRFACPDPSRDTQTRFETEADLAAALRRPRSLAEMFGDAARGAIPVDSPLNKPGLATSALRITKYDLSVFVCTMFSSLARRSVTGAAPSSTSASMWSEGWTFIPAAIAERHARAHREHPTAPVESTLVGFNAACYNTVLDLASRVTPPTRAEDIASAAPAALIRRLDGLLRAAYTDLVSRAKIFAARDLLRIDPGAPGRLVSCGVPIPRAQQKAQPMDPGAQSLRPDDAYKYARSAMSDMTTAIEKKRATHEALWAESHAVILAVFEMYQRDANPACPLCVPEGACFIAHVTAADVNRLIPVASPEVRASVLSLCVAHACEPPARLRDLARVPES